MAWKATALGALFVSLSLPQSAKAQTYTVCRGEHHSICAAKFERYGLRWENNRINFVHYGCEHPASLCPIYCKLPPGDDACRVQQTNGGGGHKCGYTLFRVTCL